MKIKIERWLSLILAGAAVGAVAAPEVSEARISTVVRVFAERTTEQWLQFLQYHTSNVRETYLSSNRFVKYQTCDVDKINALKADAEKSLADAKAAAKKGKHEVDVRAWLLGFAKKIEAAKVGNCGELAVIAFARFNQFAGLKLRVMSRLEADHSFLLVMLPDGQIYVSDPWKDGGKVFGPVTLGGDNQLYYATPDGVQVSLVGGSYGGQLEDVPPGTSPGWIASQGPPNPN